PLRPALHLPLAPPHRILGPPSQPGRERGLRVGLLRDPADDQPAAPGVGAAHGPEPRFAVLKARPGRAAARRPGAAGPPPAPPRPPHRTLDGRGGAGGGRPPPGSPPPPPAPRGPPPGDAPEPGPPRPPRHPPGARRAPPPT